jgi:hypothetical protein
MRIFSWQMWLMFGWCLVEDLAICRNYVYILQNLLQGMNQTSATFFEKMIDHFNSMDVNDCKRIPIFLESRCNIIQRECSVYNGSHMNIKAQKNQKLRKKIYNKKTHVMYKKPRRRFSIKLETWRINNHLGSCVVGCMWRCIHNGFIENMQENYKPIIIKLELFKMKGL